MELAKFFEIVELLPAFGCRCLETAIAVLAVGPIIMHALLHQRRMLAIRSVDAKFRQFATHNCCNSKPTKLLFLAFVAP